MISIICSPVKEITKGCGDDTAELFLIISAAQFRFFLRIRKKAALDQNAVFFNMFHEIYTVCSFAAPVTAGIDGVAECVLQLLCQQLTLPFRRVKYLGAAVLTVRKGILMNADEKTVFGFVHDADTLFQVRYFLCGDGLPLRID